MTVSASLARPGVRLLVGAAGVAVSGMSLDHDQVGALERRAFHRLNNLPDRLYRPAWLVMQAGTLGAVPVAAGLAYVAGRRPVVARMLAAGTATWLSAKLVKQVYRRPRPGVLLAVTRCRGKEAAGLGYVSGHAGVATTLALSAWPQLGPAGRLAALAAVPLVGVSRVYVGAHLPLDVAGGAALGLAVDGAIGLVQRRASREEPCRSPVARLFAAVLSAPELGGRAGVRSMGWRCIGAVDLRACCSSRTASPTRSFSALPWRSPRASRG